MAAPMNGYRTVEEQLADVLAAVRPLGTERRSVPDAYGTTLRETVRAAVDIPVFDNSAMDGFAVRAADAAEASPAHPVTLRVVADVPAGSDADPPLRPGDAARIMTGSPVPTDADAIVPFEDTADGLTDSLHRTTVQRAPRPHAHIRRAGEDLRAGAALLAPGTLLGPLQAGAVAAAGVAEVTVSLRPRVAIVSTGSELVSPGTPLRRGQIPESNSVLLAAMATAAGADVVMRTSVDDDGDGLRDTVDACAAASVDVVVFSGGVSAGAFEVVRNELSATMTFSRVGMQPGKPQGFGVLTRADGHPTLLFGLPGNPVSAAISFEVFVRPALLALQQRTVLHRPVLRLAASVAWRTPPGRRQYLPAVVDRAPTGWSVRPATNGGSGSHLAGGLGFARVIAIVPADVDAVAAGDTVDVWLLEGWDA